MCHNFPPLWDFSELEKFQYYSHKRDPQTWPYFFFSPSCLWCLVSSSYLVLFSVPVIYVEIYAYDDAYVKLYDDVIFTSKVQSWQLSINWVLRSQLFLSLTNSQNIYFQNFDFFLKQLYQIFRNSQ